MSNEPTLSIIIGIPAGIDEDGDAVRAWTSMSEDRPVEVIVVREGSSPADGAPRHPEHGWEGGRGEGPREPRTAPPETGVPTTLTAPRGALVPKLWAIGIAEARGEWIGLTTAHCVPGDSWIDTALSLTRDTPHAGIGGAIDAPANGAPIDWALFFARYSAYMPPIAAGTVDEIPGDNALYRASAIETSWEDRDAGFWEPLVHRVIRAGGGTLAMTPELVLRVGRSRRAMPHLAARFRHGRHFGSTRPGSPLQRLVRFCASPLLPPLLALRIVRRVRARRPDLMRRVVASSPWLLVALLAWSLGEASGYLLPGRPS